MKKFILMFFCFCVIFTACQTKNMNNMDQPSLLLKYYNGASDWHNVILGETTEEELISILQEMSEVQKDSITEIGSANNEIRTIFVKFNEGYREDSLFIKILGDQVQILNFRGAYITLATVQEKLGPIEKFNVIRFYDNFPEIHCYGYSMTAGYFLDFQYGNAWNADNIKKAAISPDEITQIILASDIGIDILIDSYMYFSVKNYLQQKSDFTDWEGYGKYSIVDID